MSSLDEDIGVLAEEAETVLNAVKELDSEILSGIESQALRNGSYVHSRVFDTLTASQKHRVLANFDKRFYERSETHGQFVVIWDVSNDSLIILAKDANNREHFCKIRLYEDMST